MHLLLIGGTVFVGRHLAAAARERGHTVTLFNRGRHNPDLFPDIEKLRGDRTTAEGLAPLAGRTFDAVIDTCGYVPHVVRLSAELLAERVKTYCFISSISVYADFQTAGIDESYPVGTLDDPSVEEVTNETYGPLKVLCERAVEEIFPGRALIVRPGLIVGPDDPTDRFTYWPHRVAQGGDVLAPGSPDRGVQLIDVRDLAQWTIRLLEEDRSGVYNAAGPDVPLRFGTMLETCKTVSGSDARFVWVDEAFLAEEEVKPGKDLPFWIPAEEKYVGFNTIRAAKAVADNLTFRPLAVTVADTLAWDAARPQTDAWKNTLSPEKERRVLEKWRERTGE